jgi:hypothetical protein
MGWREILRSEDPSRALYEHLMANQTGRTAAAAVEGAMEGVGNLVEGVGRFGHAMTVPTRAIGAIGTNLAGTAAPVDVSDYALYGADLETGRRAIQYGDLLAGTLEDAGEIAPGGVASKILSMAGNVATDPAAAPLMLSAAEGAGALAGRFSPRITTPQPTFPRMPQGRLQPQYATPRSSAPEPFDPGATQPVRTPRSGGPMRPAQGQPGPSMGPTATQKVKARSGWRPSRAKAMKPKPGAELPKDPTQTQPVKMAKGRPVRDADRTQPVRTLSEKQRKALARARHQGQRG